tara:strand:+ start:4756 stop:5655 length:900 start_codon:yes stop_codon:yes gene_type:complete
MDRFSCLNTFRRVVELEGFSNAARDLGLSNAAVSKMIKDLEAELGAQLIVRTTRSLHLTDVGQTYFTRVCHLLDDLHDADDFVRSSTENPRGHLRISAPMSFGLNRLSVLLPQFAKLYPDISIDLSMSDAFTDLVEGGFDLAIRGGRLEDSSLKARKLMDIERQVFASPDYLDKMGFPAGPSDLASHACLIYTGSSTPDVWRLEKDDRRESVPVNGTYRVNSSLAIRDAAIAGLGLAFLPDFYTLAAHADGRLLDALPGWKGEKQTLYAVYPAHRQTSRKLRLFVDFLIDAFAKPSGPA